MANLKRDGKRFREKAGAIARSLGTDGRGVVKKKNYRKNYIPNISASMSEGRR